VNAGELERRQLNATFEELCRIASPSLRERACAEHVTRELAAIGVQVQEDAAAAEVGSDCGNLLARIAGGDGESRRSLLLCAHLDTVPLAAPVEPVLEEGIWQNANEGILGADNKAAIAVILALARHVKREGAPVDLELLFTVGEEIALAGSRAFDAGKLRSSFGYVFDHATPIGELIVGSPCHFCITAAFRGAAAHAGIAPREGRSAVLAAARAIGSLRHGLIEGEGTVNVGMIEGGTAINVVPERCTVTAEVRGLDDTRGETLVAEIVDRMHEAANMPDCDCDLDLRVERTFSGYEIAPGSPALAVAEAALRSRGYRPERVRSGGGSDANALIAQGFPTINIANGTERPHEPEEQVAALALEEMLDVTLALLDEAAALPADDLDR
jgi:tripeptide aminopeptidase